MRCPLCDREHLQVLVPRRRIEAEIELRQSFFASRIDGYVDPPDRKDRMDVARGAAAEILVCPSCGVLVRHEDESPRFEEDTYAPFVMERMLRTHIDAYRRKETSYRPLLPANARVAEVGSYVGGFLHVAGEWGWNALGIDVGRDTSHFARAHGYATRSETLDACAFEAESFDGVFVWNTFEQIEEPKALLAEGHRILRPGGVLVLRVPNALFYAACQALGADVALGHANLLGFPHLFGYGSTSLDRVVNAARFETLRHIGDRHITPSLRPLTATAEREASRIDTIVSEVARAFELFQPDVIVHPWLEAIYRRA